MEVNSMSIRKKKENRLAVRPDERLGEIKSIRPFDIWSEMDSMFDRFRTDFDELFWPWREGTKPFTTMIEKRTPPMDIADFGDHYIMHLEMPGIPKDHINIEVTSNTIEISATHDESEEHKNKNWLRRERSCMSYYRALELPEDLRTENVDAELRDGILTVKLPKVEPKSETKSKRIKIR
jgi:HSP20 family protein